MFAHASLMRFFWVTNRLYEMTPAIATSTTTPSRIQTTVTVVPFEEVGPA